MSPFLFLIVYYIYILYSSKSDKYYVGYTSDVQRRLKEHNDLSRINKYTKKHIPWAIRVFFEISENRGDALAVERFIKKQKSRIFLEKLISEKDNREYLNSLISKILK